MSTNKYGHPISVWTSHSIRFIRWRKHQCISHGNIHTWSELLVPLLNMIKEGSKNKPSLLIRLILYLKKITKIVSGYVCNHGSPNGERDTASPRGRYGERLSVTRVWRYIFKNTTCWPATAHDVTTGVPQYKCRREDTSSASSSEACVRSMVQSLGDAVSRSPFGEPWLHT